VASPTRCLNCGKPVVLLPLFGWAHVGLLDATMCEEADA
jgi:hypothetical protein